jgi:hypothetical protein
MAQQSTLNATQTLVDLNYLPEKYTIGNCNG